MNPTARPFLEIADLLEDISGFAAFGAKLRDRQPAVRETSDVRRLRFSVSRQVRAAQAAQVRRPFPRWPGSRDLHATDPSIRISGRSSSSPRSTPVWRSRPGCGCTSRAMTLPGPFPGMHWHAHEMLFGYLQAVLAGFVLTAIPNWTGRLAAERVAARRPGRHCGWRAASPVPPPPDPVAALAVDVAFPAVLGLCGLARGRGRAQLEERARGGHDHAVRAGQFAGPRSQSRPRSAWPRSAAALGAVAVLMALIGGRIVPSFTRNWLVKNGETRLPAALAVWTRQRL